MPKRETRPPRRLSIPASCFAGCRGAARGRRRRRRPGRRAAHARPARPLAVLGRPGDRCDADLVILRATWDYIDRLDEFLAWTRRVPQPAQRPAGGRVEHRQALPGRPRRRGGADGAQRVLRAGGAGAHARTARSWSSPPSARDRLARSGSPTAPRRAAHAAALQADGRTVLVQPYDRGSTTVRRRWCSSAVSSPTRSPRGRCCRRPVRRRCSTTSGTYAEESLAPAEPGLRAVGRRATRRWPPRPPTWASTPPSCSTPGSM